MKLQTKLFDILVFDDGDVLFSRKENTNTDYYVIAKREIYSLELDNWNRYIYDSELSKEFYNKTKADRCIALLRKYYPELLL